MMEPGKYIKRFSDHIHFLSANIHHLKGFGSWVKRVGARNVFFETTYKEVRLKKIVTYVEVVIPIKVKIVLPPKTKDTVADFKLQLGQDVDCHTRKEVRKKIYPKVRKFINRYSL